MAASQHLIAVALAAALPLLVAAAPGDPPEPALEAAVVDLANSARLDAGLPPLDVDEELGATARHHAAEMRSEGRLHHSGPRTSGERWWRFAENVGAGYDVESVHAGFLGSDAHRAALLGGFDRVGVGVAAEPGRVWVVLQFGSLRHPEPASRPGAGGDGLAFVAAGAASWALPGGARLTYGNPGDHPIAGDWDCDGVDTPGLYRRSDGYVYLRNSASTGVAHVRFYFGDPGDLPVAGDFDGDGCDSVALYRPATGRFYVANRLGSGERGLGAADRWLALGGPGGLPLAADFDGDGIDDPAVHDPATGRVAVAGSGAGGTQLVFGDPGDVLVAGDWDGDGRATLAAYRPATGGMHFQSGAPGTMVVGGGASVVPVAGSFGR